MKKATRGQMKTAAEFSLLLLRSRGGGGKKSTSIAQPHLLSFMKLHLAKNGADLPLGPSLSHIFPAPIIFSPGGHGMLGLSVVQEPRRTGLNHPPLSTAFHSPRKKQKTKSKFMKYSSATCQKNVVQFYSQ